MPIADDKSKKPMGDDRDNSPPPFWDSNGKFHNTWQEIFDASKSNLDGYFSYDEIRRRRMNDVLNIVKSHTLHNFVLHFPKSFGAVDLGAEIGIGGQVLLAYDGGFEYVYLVEQHQEFLNQENYIDLGAVQEGRLKLHYGMDSLDFLAQCPEESFGLITVFMMDAGMYGFDPKHHNDTMGEKKFMEFTQALLRTLRPGGYIIVTYNPDENTAIHLQSANKQFGNLFTILHDYPGGSSIWDKCIAYAEKPGYHLLRTRMIDADLL